MLDSVKFEAADMPVVQRALRQMPTADGLARLVCLLERRHAFPIKSLDSLRAALGEPPTHNGHELDLDALEKYLKPGDLPVETVEQFVVTALRLLRRADPRNVAPALDGFIPLPGDVAEADKPPEG
jgi:hypothetical protein